MDRKCLRVGVAAALVALVGLLGGARADDIPKATDEGKAEDFKGKAYDVKEKGAVALALAFPAGKKAHLTIKSDKKSDVNLFVYDAAGKEVAKDDSPGPDCDLTFTPKEAGKFTLVIRNLGPGDNKANLKVEVAK
jgi:hypothetical protein